MDAYILGNLAGRLVMSALLVYFIVLCFNRFQFKIALLKMKRPVPIIACLALFIIGLASNALADEQPKKTFPATAATPETESQPRKAADVSVPATEGGYNGSLISSYVPKSILQKNPATSKNPTNPISLTDPVNPSPALK